MNISKTVIVSIATYGGEAWILTRASIRKIYGGVQEENDWRILYIFQWFGHIRRMDDSQMSEKHFLLSTSYIYLPALPSAARHLELNLSSISSFFWQCKNYIFQK